MQLKKEILTITETEEVDLLSIKGAIALANKPGYSNNEEDDLMPRYKIVFTDYYYPDNDREVEILQQLGDVEIVDCTNIQPGGIKDLVTLLEYVKDAGWGNPSVCEIHENGDRPIREMPGDCALCHWG